MYITGWIALSPGALDIPDRAEGFANQLWELLHPYGGLAISCRPWKVPSFPLLTLSELLANKSIDSFSLETLDYPEPTAFVKARVNLAHGDDRSAACIAFAEIQPTSRENIAPTANSLAAFLKGYFGSFDASAAFVSMSDVLANRRVVGDHAMGTALEIERRSILRAWPDTQRFARGAFWGNGLGADLCARLGGQAKVLRDAPVFRSEPVGHGVWLQVTKDFPPDQDAINRLSEYLLPVLDWNEADLTKSFT